MDPSLTVDLLCIADVQIYARRVRCEQVVARLPPHPIHTPVSVKWVEATKFASPQKDQDKNHIKSSFDSADETTTTTTTTTVGLLKLAPVLEGQHQFHQRTRARTVEVINRPSLFGVCPGKHATLNLPVKLSSADSSIHSIPVFFVGCISQFVISGWPSPQQADPGVFQPDKHLHTPITSSVTKLRSPEPTHSPSSLSGFDMTNVVGSTSALMLISVHVSNAANVPVHFAEAVDVVSISQ